MHAPALSKPSASPRVHRPARPTKKQIAKIPLTEQEHQRLILPPRQCIKHYRAGEQNANDWYILSFRIRMGRYVVQMHYSQEVMQALDLAYRVTLEMLAYHRLKADYNWSATQAQIDTLEDALDLVDAIQRDTDRKTLIFCTRKSYAEMIPYAQ